MTTSRQPRRGSAWLRQLGAALLVSASCAGTARAQSEPAPAEAAFDANARPAPAEPSKAKPAAPAAANAKKTQAPWLRKDTAPSKSSSGSDSISVLRFTLFGIVLFALAMYALYRHQRRGLGRPSAPRSTLTLEGAVRVGPKAQVVVVNVAGRKLLLGVTEAEVSRLAWLDDGMEPDAELASERAELAPARTSPAEPRSYAALEPRRPVPAASQEALPARPTAAVTNATPVTTGAKPKRFRDALLGALGQPRAAQPDAALAIAETTQDVVTRSQTAPIAAPSGAPDMVDVEGQARGLVMRLQKRA